MAHDRGDAGRRGVGTSRVSQGYGPAVDEPPLLVDPRRWGSLIGLVGGLVFIGSYSPVLGAAVASLAWTAGIVLAASVLFAHYVRPVSLGPLARPHPHALAIYGGSVVGQLALIAAGTRALTATDHGGLQPALIATVVGLHFIPFAWAFREPKFLRLGAAVAGAGAVGLATGALGLPHAADASAVLAGLIMLAIMAVWALGRFGPSVAKSGE